MARASKSIGTPDGRTDLLGMAIRISAEDTVVDILFASTGTGRPFVQEVRRLYPFVPVLAARARTGQDVLGVHVPRGGHVVLDVHGTDHDPAHWPEPDRFDPNRFLQGDVDPDTLVPQGGGDVADGHRCPGEGVTLTMLAVATRALARLPHALPPRTSVTT